MYICLTYEHCLLILLHESFMQPRLPNFRYINRTPPDDKLADEVKSDVNALPTFQVDFQPKTVFNEYNLDAIAEALGNLADINDGKLLPEFFEEKRTNLQLLRDNFGCDYNSTTRINLLKNGWIALWNTPYKIISTPRGFVYEFAGSVYNALANHFLSSISTLQSHAQAPYLDTYSYMSANDKTIFARGSLHLSDTTYTFSSQNYPITTELYGNNVFSPLTDKYSVVIAIPNQIIVVDSSGKIVSSMKDSANCITV